MNLSITTTANNGHLILFIIDNALTILQLRDSDKGTVMLVPGRTYRFEWHVWSPEAADYSIQATVHPARSGFPPFDYAKEYKAAHKDMGGFFFTI